MSSEPLNPGKKTKQKTKRNKNLTNRVMQDPSAPASLCWSSFHSNDQLTGHYPLYIMWYKFHFILEVK